MFTAHTTDKSAAVDRAAYIAKNFEPNSNYDLAILIHRDRTDSKWHIYLQLVFPKLHYKRKVKQQSLLQGLEHHPVARRRRRDRVASRLAKRLILLVDEYQKTLDFFTL